MAFGKQDRKAARRRAARKPRAQACTAGAGEAKQRPSQTLSPLHLTGGIRDNNQVLITRQKTDGIWIWGILQGLYHLGTEIKLHIPKKTNC